MHIPVYQSISLALHTTAFGALNYSDNLNELASRITGSRVTRNTLAEAVLHQAIGLGLSIGSTHKAVDKYAESIAGITGAQLIGYTDQILRGTDDSQFSASIKELLTHTLDKQAAAGNIPDEAKEPAINLAQNLINSYIGKQAIHQFLGAYAQNHGWESLTEKIQNTLVPDGKFTYTNLLILAGVRAGTDFVQILVERAILENPSFQQNGEFYAKPELKLAADCLHAYLVNDENCMEALTNYTPTKPLIDESFLRDVAGLTTALATQAQRDAAKVLADANSALQKENLKSAPRAPASESAATRNDEENELEGAVPIDATKDEVPVDISDFVMIDTQAQAAVKDATKAYNQAETFKAISEATGIVLLADPGTRNPERIGDALSVLLKAIPGDFGRESGLTALLKTTELPAQNIIGTYVAMYGWDGLETLLTNAVDKNLSRLENAAVEWAAKRAAQQARHTESALKAQQEANEYAIQWAQDNPGTQNAALRVPAPQSEQGTPQTKSEAVNSPKKRQARSSQQTESKERAWVRRAVPTLAIKLAIQHLRPYIDGGDFKHPNNPEYAAIAALLHRNQEALGGDISPAQIAFNSAPVAAQYLGARALDGAQYLGSAAVNYTSSAAQAGAAIVGAQIQSISDQFMAAGGFVNALLSPAVSVATTDGGFVAGLWNRLNPVSAATDGTGVVPTAIHNDALESNILAT